MWLGRGESRGQKGIFLLSDISYPFLKNWVICVLELFTELKNIHPLPRYDVANLGPTRSFSGICMEKDHEKLKFCFLKIVSTFHQITQIW